MVAHVFNPSTQEAEAGRQGQPRLQSEFQDNQDYTEKPCLEKQKQKNQPTKQTNKQKMSVRDWYLPMGWVSIWTS